MTTLITEVPNKDVYLENIQVVVRIRPMQKHELLKRQKICVKSISDGKEVQIKVDSKDSQIYKCNFCFPRDTNQIDFFEQSQVPDLIDTAVGGYRSTIFAFGQTGAGKTYTLVGPSRSISPGHIGDGIIGQSLGYLYSKIETIQVELSVKISCFEIYHENVYDLLADDRNRIPLAVREHSVEGFYLEGSKLILCPTFEDACHIVDMAMKNRHIGQHDMNIRSNRSHCITEIYIDSVNDELQHVEESNKDGAGYYHTASSQNRRSSKKLVSDPLIRPKDFVATGKLTLVDLAGSERLKSTNSVGKIRKETGFINKSLYVLGKVIAGLSRTQGDLGHRDVPYRDSKLTKLLINSLGGNGRTMLIACVSEASGSGAESMRTLKFSMSCARIKNRLVKFLDPQQKLITGLKEEIRRLRQENEELKHYIGSPSKSSLKKSYRSPNSSNSPFELIQMPPNTTTLQNFKNINSGILQNTQPRKQKSQSLQQIQTVKANPRKSISQDEKMLELEQRLALLEKSKITKVSHNTTKDAIHRNPQVKNAISDNVTSNKFRSSQLVVTNSRKNSNSITVTTSSKQMDVNDNKKSYNVSSGGGDLLSDYLDAIEDDDDAIKPSTKIPKRITSNQPEISRSKNIPVSPYVSHLIGNPTKVKDIVGMEKILPKLSSRQNLNSKLVDNKSNVKLDIPTVTTSFPSLSSSNDNSITKPQQLLKPPTSNLFKTAEVSISDILLPSETRNGIEKDTTIKLDFKREKAITSVNSKLNQLEQELADQRIEMEDNPGEVTAETEKQLAVMEKEARMMRKEIESFSESEKSIANENIIPVEVVIKNKSPKLKNSHDDSYDEYAEDFEAYDDDFEA